MQTFVIALLRGYRYFVSPLIGRHCRFYPSCSSYALGVLEQQGLVRGSWLALRRLARCHPWHPGGFDPIPLPRTEPGSSRQHG